MIINCNFYAWFITCFIFTFPLILPSSVFSESFKHKATNSIGQTFVYIKPGMFMMGSPLNEKERKDHERLHKVTLTKGFYMHITEVTQGQWKAVMGSNPSRFEHCGDDCPVENVTWNDVQKFIHKLNKRSSKKTYRLPTEAEWEYAARAGTTTPFNSGDYLSTDDANYNGEKPYSSCSKGQYRKKTISVRSFQPNSWGLYDMHGNVWEWCQDWLGDYSISDVIDPTGPPRGSLRVIRGGSWHFPLRYCRSAYRYGGDVDGHAPYLGFRLVLHLTQ